MSKNRHRNANKRRRDRSVLDEPQDSFWRNPSAVTTYDDLRMYDTLEDDRDAEWARRVTSTPAYFKPWPKYGTGDYLERILFRQRRRFPDWDWVTDDVSTGGFVKNAAEARTLVAAGVTHVVNTASEWEAEGEVYDGLPIEYLFNPTVDDYRWKDPEWFERTLDFALPAIAQGGHVLIHCLEGINRGPSSAYAVLRAQGHSIKDAKALITDVRPTAKVRYALDAEAAREVRP